MSCSPPWVSSGTVSSQSRDMEASVSKSASVIGMFSGTTPLRRLSCTEELTYFHETEPPSKSSYGGENWQPNCLSRMRREVTRCEPKATGDSSGLLPR